MFIDKNWKYNEILKHAEALKTEYKEVLASFLWHEGKKRLAYIKEIKKTIYSLKIEEWKKNKIWEYFNDDIKLLDIKRYR